MKDVLYAITTFDNPFDPFDEFESWLQYDTDHNYGTCAYLARIAHTSDQMTNQEKRVEIKRAIDEIIKYDFKNIYKRVKKEIDS